MVLALALVFAYYRFLGAHLTEQAARVLLSLFAGFADVMLLSTLWTLVRGTGELAALKREEKGEPKEDGRLEAAAGTIHPLSDPILSPFLARECVAYEYDIGPPRREDDTSARNYFGVALTPSTIRTPTGSVALLGWTLIDDFPRKKVDSDQERQRAEKWVSQTRFEKMTLGGVFSTLGELMADDDGSLRKDWYTEPRPASLAGLVIRERVVEPGREVAAIGYFSAAKGGLVPKMGSKQVVCQLLPGGLSRVR